MALAVFKVRPDPKTRQYQPDYGFFRALSIVETNHGDFECLTE